METTLYAPLDAAARQGLQQLLASQRTLEDVVRWGLGQEPPVLIADVVVQDEYTHDVVVAYGRHFLVYDAT